VHGLWRMVYCSVIVIVACFPVVEQTGLDGETAADYDSRSLMQFCKSRQLLLGAYELLSGQHKSTASTESMPSSAAEHDVKQVGHISLSSCTYNYIQTC